MIELSVATFLVQWAAGGLLFCWVTTRHRVVGPGYGWLLRATYGLLALGGFITGRVFSPHLVRDGAALLMVVFSAVALAQSFQRRKAGVSGQRELAEARTNRVAAMTGIDRKPEAKSGGPEFNPSLDLPGPLVGLVGVVVFGLSTGDPALLATARLLAGAAFLGAVSDAMLLGHWYLVQPGLSRAPLSELVRWTGLLWVPEVALLLIPTGMGSVLTGTIDDGWGGMLGWFWAGSAVTTIALIGVTVAALREKQYSAVMAATGLLYLAILTAFCTDLVARALLA